MNADPPPSRGLLRKSWPVWTALVLGFGGGTGAMYFCQPDSQIIVMQEPAASDPRVSLEQVLQDSRAELAAMRARLEDEKDRATANGEERELWVASQGLALQRQTRELEYLRARNTRLDADLKDLVRRYTLATDELHSLRGTPATVPQARSMATQDPVLVASGPGYVPPYRPPVRSGTMVAKE